MEEALQGLRSKERERVREVLLTQAQTLRDLDSVLGARLSPEERDKVFGRALDAFAATSAAAVQQVFQLRRKQQPRALSPELRVVSSRMSEGQTSLEGTPPINIKKNKAAAEIDLSQFRDRSLQSLAGRRRSSVH